MKFCLSILAVLISFGAVACDVCGGVTPSGGDGLLVGNQFHFIGLRTNYGRFQSFHRNPFSEETTTSWEHFTRANISGRWQFSERFNAQVNIPYAINLQRIDNGNQLRHGLGDISLLVQWMLISTKNEAGTSHFLAIGSGVKAPTGNYSRDPWETSNLFPGSGSWDPQFNLSYRFSKNKFNFQVENGFTLKTQNPVGYRFGNAVSSIATAFYSINTKKNGKLLPLMGIGYTYTGSDHINSYLVAESFNSGHLLSTEIGLNYLTKNWILNTKWSQPFVQSIADGDVESKGLLEFGIHYLIQKK